MTAFIILAIFLTLQSLWSLREGFQFLNLIRRSWKRLPGPYHPPAVVIIPCKGVDPNLEENTARFLSQDYPAYQVIFVVATPNDAAWRALTKILSAHAGSAKAQQVKASLIAAGYSETNGEKVHNLLAGLQAVEPEVEILVFADIDARPSSNWLRFLVAPLKDATVTMSTGFRWYVPDASFTSKLRAAWDASIATMLGEHRHNFAWGGSMAIRKADFERLKVAESYWQGTVSDDYAITRAVRKARGIIRFEPRCLVTTRNDAGFGQFLRWANRQIIITRVYNARYWKLGVASYSLYALTFILGLIVILMPGAAAGHRVTAAAFLLAILALGMAKGSIRTVAAREMFPEEKDALRRYGACYWQLAPLVPWIMLFNFVSAAFLRRIEWRGTVYELKSVHKLKVIRREA
jgi:ceramide glucosyltransferase